MDCLRESLSEWARLATGLPVARAFSRGRCGNQVDTGPSELIGDPIALEPRTVAAVQNQDLRPGKATGHDISQRYARDGGGMQPLHICVSCAEEQLLVLRAAVPAVVQKQDIVWFCSAEKLLDGYGDLA